MGFLQFPGLGGVDPLLGAVGIMNSLSLGNLLFWAWFRGQIQDRPERRAPAQEVPTLRRKSL